MAISLNLALRNSQANALRDALAAGGTLEIWDGTPPATPETSNTGDTLLSTVTVPANPFAAASAGAIAATGLPWEDEDNIDASGTAQYFRLTVGTMVIQGTVGTGGGADLQVDNANFIQGGSFEITGFTITQP